MLPNLETDRQGLGLGPRRKVAESCVVAASRSTVLEGCLAKIVTNLSIVGTESSKQARALFDVNLKHAPVGRGKVPVERHVQLPLDEIAREPNHIPVTPAAVPLVGSSMPLELPRPIDCPR